jgi:hypothetical membrane protein
MTRPRLNTVLRPVRSRQTMNTSGVISNRTQMIAPAAMVLAALLVPVATLCFASLRPDYSHTSNTISELGEAGAPHAKQVAFVFFLPVGLLVWLALGLVWRQAPDKYVATALIALSGLGLGYLVAAFFPCDPGAPLYGTWRTLVHNLAGFIDYVGTGLGFLIAILAFAFLVAGGLVLVCTVLLSSEFAFHIRGAIQRLAECVQFIGVLWVCYWLPKNR